MKTLKLFLILLKRLSKKFSFLFLILIVPILSFGITNMSKGESAKTQVGLMFEDDFGDKYFDDICVYGDAIEFIKYDNKEDLLLDVQKEKIDCGFVFTDNFKYKLLNNDWEKSIISYISPASLLQSMAQEQIACGVFNIYSDYCYKEYISSNLGEDKLEFATDSYKKHLEDASTFAIEYINDFDEVDGEIINQKSGNFEINLKGILGILLFLAGLDSLLLNRSDIDEKRFMTYCSNTNITLINIFTQTFVMSVIIFISLILTKNYENIFIEFCNLLLYLIIVIIYCFVLSLILRKKESIATAIPILVLLSLICCPVIIDVSTYIPFISYISKIFPLTYYL